MECHADKQAEGEKNGKKISTYVSLDDYNKSVHASLTCIDCHTDIKEFPHNDELKPVDCKICHEDVMKQFSKSIHGEAVLTRKDQFAPTCASCHGTHTIKPSSDPSSKTYVMNIPTTCGRCHMEGTEMTATHQIEEKDVVANYALSIHGEGLYKRGLIVSAVCTSCHGSHNILPHLNPESKINRANLAKTCMTCHAQIEQVHEKIVKGKLWEQEPNHFPVCIECHAAHKMRRVYYEDLPISDNVCLSCHSNFDLKMEKSGKQVSLLVDKDKLSHSVHANVSCVKCHYDVDPKKTPVCKGMKPVDCSSCHANQVNDFKQSIHGKFLAKNDPNAPSCGTCHSTHDILSKKDQASPTFTRNIPNLCAKCHGDNNVIGLRGTSKENHILQNYSMGIHGKGLNESGLMVTAVCTDCHTSHKELPAADPVSSVNPLHVEKTCAKCHLGIYEQFRTSIHSAEANGRDKNLPGCNDCHQSHKIVRIDNTDFRGQIIDQCGRCHKEQTSTYFDTYHGKVTKLGDSKPAKCYDCHGAHTIYPSSDIRSALNRTHIIATCQKCHPGSNRKFTGYLTHATHHDRGNYPALFYSFWFMTILLTGTLSFFGIHSFLWLIRSLIFHFKERDKELKRSILQTGTGKYYRRFKPWHRITHLFVVLSFLSLAVTGMALKFPDTKIFDLITRCLGGPGVTGVIHRIGAIITFGYFGVHLFFIIRMLIRKEITLKGLLHEDYTLLPTMRDAAQLKQNFLWFFGKAEKPKFGRWTYFEKFDYFAVFWGVGIIGTTGLILWFPEIATLILPGWVINVATVIHSDEALLATAFIFTIHFFNTHFRPGIFPMDPVIFTGRIPLEEFKTERPHEYQQLLDSGELDKYLVDAPSKWVAWSALIFGFTFLTIGLIMVASILYSMLFIYF